MMQRRLFLGSIATLTAGLLLDPERLLPSRTYFDLGARPHFVPGWRIIGRDARWQAVYDFVLPDTGGSGHRPTTVGDLYPGHPSVVSVEATRTDDPTDTLGYRGLTTDGVNVLSGAPLDPTVPGFWYDGRGYYGTPPRRVREADVTPQRLQMYPPLARAAGATFPFPDHTVRGTSLLTHGDGVGAAFPYGPVRGGAIVTGRVQGRPR